VALAEKYWDELEELLDIEIEKAAAPRRARRKKRGWFSISNAGYCGRATILNRLNAKEDEHDAKTMRKFWIGDLIHNAIRAVVEKSGRLIAAEQFVSSGFGDNPDDVVGAFDFILKSKDGTKNILYELKSKNTGAFWTMILKTKQASKHNIYQAITYWEKNKKYRVDELRLVYFSKDDAAMKSYRIEVTDELRKEVTDWWEDLRQQYKNKHLPDPFLPDTVEYKGWCKYCSFRQHYCEGDPEVLEDNLVQLDWDV